MEKNFQIFGKKSSFPFKKLFFYSSLPFVFAFQERYKLVDLKSFLDIFFLFSWNFLRQKSSSTFRCFASRIVHYPRRPTCAFSDSRNLYKRKAWALCPLSGPSPVYSFLALICEFYLSKFSSPLLKSSQSLGTLRLYDQFCNVFRHRSAKSLLNKSHTEGGSSKTEKRPR